ncbi:MAG TPA: hypothetical protein VFC38_01190 [Stellaceae bacterium]|nr:hypothetical protein [Stellaceae bacterium]
MIRERGASAVVLDGIASDAALICSQPLYRKMQLRAAAFGGLQTMNDEITNEQIDQANYGRHAFSVAIEQSKNCVPPHK